MSLGWQGICKLDSVRAYQTSDLQLVVLRKDETMGDKGGKKDKDKSKKQKADKQQQKVKAGQDKNRPKA